MTILLPEMGKRLRTARATKGISICDAAKTSGYSERTIRRYEKEGIRDVLVLATMCEVYDVHIEIVLFGEFRKPQRLSDALPQECITSLKTLAQRIKDEEAW